MELKALTCGCRVDVSRDFLGRVVGRIVEKSASCERMEHETDRVVIMPGRENARLE